MCRNAFSALFLLAAGVSGSWSVHAGEADLDPAFGPNGDGRIVFAGDVGSVDAAHRIVSTDSGAIFVVGITGSGIGIVRLTANGLPDAQFPPMRYPGGNIHRAGALAAIEAADGDIVVAGYFGDYDPVTQPHWLVCRFDADGTPDAAFGDGAIAPGCTSEFATGSSLRGEIRDVAIQANGRIVLAGYILDDANVRRAAMSRLTAQGAPDLTFDAGNNLVLPLGNVVQGSEYHALTIGTVGDLIAAGDYLLPDEEGDILVTRHTANGAPQAGFGANGVGIYDLQLGPVGARRDTARAVALLPQGRIAVAGAAQCDANQKTAGVMLWLKGNGIVETTFGNNGRTIIEFEELSVASTDIASTPAGRVLIGATVYGKSGGALGVVVGTRENGDIDEAMLAQLQFVDSLDDMPNTTLVFDIELQDDRVLVGGSTQGWDQPGSDVGVARLGDRKIFSDGLESGA